jgi:hypothetical protein
MYPYVQCDEPCPAEYMMYPCADYVFLFFNGCKLMSNKYTYVKEYRYTNMGGITKYIAVCITCKSVIPPTDTRRSRRGTHGEDYYTHEHELRFVLLHSSNSGRKEIIIPKELEKITKDLEKMWIYENASVYEIIEFINSYLSKL